MKKRNPLFFKLLSTVLVFALVLSTLASTLTISAESTANVHDGSVITFEDGVFPTGVAGSSVTGAT